MSETSPENHWQPTGKVVSAEQFQAWHDARDLLQNSHAHIDKVKAEAAAKGYEAGEMEGRQAVLRVLIDTQTRAERYLDQMDREVAAIVIALVERIIGKSPKQDRTLAAARQALASLRKHKQLVVHVPPADFERFQIALADLPSPAGNKDWLLVEADPHLEPEECVIETDVGYIRAGIDAQLENLRQTVFESLQSRHDGT